MIKMNFLVGNLTVDDLLNNVFGGDIDFMELVFSMEEVEINEDKLYNIYEYENDDESIAGTIFQPFDKPVESMDSEK